MFNSATQNKIEDTTTYIRHMDMKSSKTIADNDNSSQRIHSAENDPFFKVFRNCYIL